MRCLKCGTPLPNGSQFCLRCGAPVPTSATPPSATPTTSIPAQPNTLREIPRIAGAPVVAPVRRPGPPKALLTLLVLLALGLTAVTAAVVRHGRGVASAGTPTSPPGSVANAPSPTPEGGSVANTPSPTPEGGGVANAPSPSLPAGAVANAPGPSLAGGAVANAPGPSLEGGAVANAPAPPVQGGPVANAPNAQSPENAQPMDDVMPYLRALARIEAQRQQYNAQMYNQLGEIFGSYTGGGHVGSPEAVTTNLLTQLMSGDLDEAADKIGKDLAALIPATQAIAQEHVDLVQQVDGLEKVPGVPPSCRDLQGFYRAALTPFVSLANATSSNLPVSAQGGHLSIPSSISSEKVGELQSLLPKLLGAQQEESSRLVEAEQALDQVFSSHHIEPFFRVQDTEQSGSGGLMSAPYTPGR